MKVVVGLGNPDKKYERTRHNVGFLVIDALAHKYKVEINEYNFESLLCRIKIEDRETLLVKPLTYMNLAGAAVRQIVQSFRLELKDILIINDDADLPLGRIKICRKRGDAGHLGVRSVIENLGSKEFSRLRIGIGRAPEQMQLSEYVLQEFNYEEWNLMQEVLLRASLAVEKVILEGIEEAMVGFN
ncbi:aminoacyl-tRNA hydrolase [Candidatus Aerophobetes bacterium]|nr:aminoacyl-tRNA hydrolase [Candidatus Aerophobetes bacterium]